MNRQDCGKALIAAGAILIMAPLAHSQDRQGLARPECKVSSVTSFDQVGGITAGCLYMTPPPSPRIAAELVGNWEGVSDCSTGVEHITWEISQGGDGQIQVQEAYEASRRFKAVGHQFYDARWSDPMLILTSSSLTRYRIAVQPTGKHELSGRYFNHMNCMTITLHKVS